MSPDSQSIEQFAREDERMYFTSYDSPIGTLVLVAREAGLAAIHFPNGKKQPAAMDDWTCSSGFFTDVVSQLDDYFAGNLKVFDVKLAPAGTDFQRQVWDALLDIAYGETSSYGAIAEKLGNPGAARAIGAANGANPIPIIIPCHRVIGSNGTLTGFGGGLPTKQWLLGHESGELSLFPFHDWTT